jgi:PucR family transcriptional regulator, purine catabolism regulatory protein
MGDVANDPVLAGGHVPAQVLRRTAAARSEEVHRALVQVVVDGGGLQEVTDELAGVLGGVVAATTPDGRVQAVSGAAADVARVLASSHVDGSGRWRVERVPAGVVPDPESPGGTGSLAAVPVVAGGVHHGRIIAFSGTRLHAADVTALEAAATVAALVVTKALAVRAVEAKYSGDFLHDLVSGRPGSGEQAVPHAASLGWDVDRPLVVLVAELDPCPPAAPPSAEVLRPAQERFTAAWTSVVHGRDPRAAVAGFAAEVVVLLGAPAGGDVERAVDELVHAVSGDGGGGRRSFTCGVSRVVPDVRGLPAAYDQARKAVHVGRQLHGTGGVAHFDRLGVFRLLSLVPDSRELREFVTETLRGLAADDADAADLRRTLEVLLETNLNVAESARRLHFHYNTLRYRIGRLERLLGPFTDDPALRLDLALALQVLRMRGV